MPFDPEWSLHCADRAAAHVLTTAGLDVWAVLGASAPRSWGETAALYRRHGVRSLGALVSKALGPSVSPLLAMRGDIVRRGWALGICRGELAEFVNETVGMDQVEEAWRLTSYPVFASRSVPPVQAFSSDWQSVPAA
ncbi:DUF6950 family protein [Sphingomonas sp.]|uniref:DUF6950 family protein n=1 Tax=Sphingomonas sp. TaxID=28214 RepID=UPI003B3A4D16